MKIRFTLSLLLVLLVAGALNARPRTVQEAKNVAVSYYSGLQQLRSAQPVDFELVYTGPSTGLRSSSDPYYYVFNASGSKGFVMVSGDDRVLPILGYSTTSSFNPENLPSNLLGWLEGYEKQIDYILSLPEEVQPVTAPQTRADDNFADHIDPMIKTEWDQIAPYNDLCPMDGNVRSLTGCMATALSQVMYYYKWPEKGQGAITYHADQLDQDISVNFEDYTFDWENMTEKYNSESTPLQNTAVARLMYAIGAAVKMDYSSTISIANLDNAVNAFIQYMGYDENIHFIRRDFYPTSDWVSLIKKELNSKRPICYRGDSFDGAHIFICDGYDKEDLFHINWGWGGIADGYFQLDILNPYFQYDAGIGGFSYGQMMIVGIQKPNKTSEKPSSEILQYYFQLLNYPLQQGDSLTTNTLFVFDGNKRKQFELALALYKNDSMYKILKNRQFELDPIHSYNIYITDTIAPFILPEGEYILKYIYRSVGEEQWTDMIRYKSANDNLYYRLISTKNNIKIYESATKLVFSELTVDKELRANSSNTFYTKIKNLSGVEIFPFIYLYYAPVDDLNQAETLTIEKIYLLNNEEKELAMPVLLNMKPGRYVFGLTYANNAGYADTLEETESIFEILPEEDDTAIDNLTVAEDLKVSVANKILSVRSDTPVESLQIISLTGGKLYNSSPRTTDINLPLGWMTSGVYAVAVKNATGWHTCKIVL